jgi:Phosphoribosylanthranilate isomerase
LTGTKAYGEAADFFLFDTKTGGISGGTGRTFDWSVLAEARFSRPFILAGGLGPENVREALGQVRPSAVDLNSRTRGPHRASRTTGSWPGRSWP